MADDRAATSESKLSAYENKIIVGLGTFLIGWMVYLTFNNIQLSIKISNMPQTKEITELFQNSYAYERERSSDRFHAIDNRIESISQNQNSRIDGLNQNQKEIIAMINGLISKNEEDRIALRELIVKYSIDNAYQQKKGPR